MKTQITNVPEPKSDREIVTGEPPKRRICLGDIHRKGGAFPNRKKMADKTKCRKKIMKDSDVAE